MTYSSPHWSECQARCQSDIAGHMGLNSHREMKRLKDGTQRFMFRVRFVRVMLNSEFVQPCFDDMFEDSGGNEWCDMVCVKTAQAYQPY